MLGIKDSATARRSEKIKIKQTQMQGKFLHLSLVGE